MPVQNEVLAGRWTGYLTQEEGGYATKYNFEMFFTQNKGRWIGRSRVTVEELFVEMEFTAEYKDKKLTFLEYRMVDNKIRPGMEWCYKKGQLELKEGWWSGLRLEGSWQGATSFGDCIPGDVYLIKEQPRA